MTEVRRRGTSGRQVRNGAPNEESPLRLHVKVLSMSLPRIVDWRKCNSRQKILDFEHASGAASPVFNAADDVGRTTEGHTEQLVPTQTHGKTTR